MQPTVWFRQALNRRIDPVDQFPEPVLVPVSAVAVQKMEERRITFFEIFFQEPVHCLRFQKRLLGVITDFKVRLHLRHVKISSDDFQGKGMKRTDLCLRQQIHLLPEKRHLLSQFYFLRPFPRLFQPVCQFSGGPGDGSADLFFHLGSSRIGKGHDQHPVDRTAVLQNKTLDPLHQYGRLAGSGRCRYQQIFPPLFDCLSLFFGPFHL